MGLYRDDRLIALCSINNQKTQKIPKKIISFFKSIDLNIEIRINLAKVKFLDVTFNIERNTYRPYKTPNDNLPQIMKHLTQTISERLSRNFSSPKIFEQGKPDCEKALQKCG